MSESFLACPRCGCLKYYARGRNGATIFFRINGDLRPVPTGVNSSDLSQADFSPTHCTGCSWSGEIGALRPEA